ncbi:3-deoxy-D-manno-octulosonic acid transferase [Pseudomonas syringae pv. spinaceae]|uniref:3-deoxy-D-manno-octulosonic acid transferase n=1 Tax=Pseudomonas syringae pv. spinaceae TaxID=264459 RepID=A0A0Q0CWI6_PSESX|nr:3-deoxy-D-manno-octulosonic acid transferase [Pseudomonas syringae pv. spinaceae]
MSQKIIFNATVQQLRRAVGIQRLGQASFAFGRRQAVGRVVLAEAFTVQVLVEAAHCRQHSRQAARGLALLMLAGGEAAQVLDIQIIPARQPRFLAIRQNLAQVASVGFKCVRRHLPLTAQVHAVGVQMLFHS